MELIGINATRMKTSSTGPLLKIDDVSPSLINFTKLYRDPAGQSTKPECLNNEQSFIAQCREDIRSTLTATECSLYWCINYYSATKESGVLKESIIDSWWSRSDSVFVTVDDPLGGTLGDHIQLLPSKDELNISDQLNISDHGKNLGRDDSDHAQRHQKPAKYDPCYVEDYTNRYLVVWLKKFFTTEMDTSVSLGQDFDTHDVAVVLSGQNKWPSGERSGVPQPDPVFDIFSNVASGLTQFIRRDRQSLPHAGEADNYLVEIDGERQALNFVAKGTAFEDRTVVQRQRSEVQDSTYQKKQFATTPFPNNPKKDTRHVHAANAAAAQIHHPNVQRAQVRQKHARLSPQHLNQTQWPRASPTTNIQWDLVQHFAQQGHNIIIDSACNYPEVLNRGSECAVQHGCAYWYVECRANDMDLLDRRLRSRDSLPSQRTAVDSPPQAAGAATAAAAGGGEEDQRAVFRKWMEDPCRFGEDALDREEVRVRWLLGIQEADIMATTTTFTPRSVDSSKGLRF
ncbi:MAG: hypothetical protein Q9178_007926 [Gyalolechia marmorata]